MDQRRVRARPILRQGAFFIKYYSIAFAILPGIAGGVALELNRTNNELGKEHL